MGRHRSAWQTRNARLVWRMIRSISGPGGSAVVIIVVHAIGCSGGIGIRRRDGHPCDLVHRERQQVQAHVFGALRHRRVTVAPGDRVRSAAWMVACSAVTSSRSSSAVTSRW